jgi:RHH-type transcriptional regulator, proline utilization regulon repressor / proline dehydrogenase / delta 1-pyrroline-5-carboxylate dehydrogenase
VSVVKSAPCFLKKTLASGLAGCLLLSGPMPAARAGQADRRYARLPAGSAVSDLPLPRSLEAGRPLPGGAVLPSVPAGASSALPAWLAAWPAAYADVKEVRAVPGARRWVIQVQDVHGHLGTQRNISGLVSALAGRGATRIGLEGAAGPFDLRPYREFPRPAVMNAVADYLLRKDLLSGAEHAAWTASPAAELVGLEEPALYDANVRAFKAGMAAQPGLRAALEEGRRALDGLRPRLLSPALRAFEVRRRRHREGTFGLTDHVAALAAAAPREAARLPNIDRFARAAALERGLDFGAAREERRRLVERLGGLLPEEGLAELLDMGLALRLGRLSGAAFHARLSELSDRAGLDRKEFPAYEAYARYARLAEGVDVSRLAAELRELENAVLAPLLREPDQRELMDLSEDLNVLRKLADFAMTPEDWSAFAADGERALTFPARLEALLRRHGAGPSAVPGDLASLIRPCLDFCALAERRNRALVDNLLREGEGPAVLVAGGFHTPGITRLLRERNVSYVVAAPRLDAGAVPDGAAALEAFAKGPGRLADALSGERINLKPPIVGTGALFEVGGEEYGGAWKVRLTAAAALLLWQAAEGGREGDVPAELRRALQRFFRGAPPEVSVTDVRPAAAPGGPSRFTLWIDGVPLEALVKPGATPKDLESLRGAAEYLSAEREGRLLDAGALGDVSFALSLRRSWRRGFVRRLLAAGRLAWGGGRAPPEPAAVSGVEADARRIGREIFAAMARQGAAFDMNAVRDLFMGFGMGSPDLKVKLLQFLDVSPALKTARQTKGQLLEIFADRPLERTLIALVPARLLAWSALTGVRWMARRFIAGSDVAEVLPAIAALRAKGADVTLDVLGEGLTTLRQADELTETYITLLREVPRSNVSLKLTALAPNFNALNVRGQEDVKRNLRRILRAARDKPDTFVYVDMEEYALRDATLAVYRDVLDEDEFRGFDRAGIIVQAYLKDSEESLRALMAWSRERGRTTPIRLVKGAYWDQEHVWSYQEDRPFIPVFAEKWQTDANYEKLAELVLVDMADSAAAGRPAAVSPAFGTHNVRSIAKILALTEALGLAKESIEIQMLYGMGDRIWKALVARGYRTRVYTPYGPLIPGMAYLVRRVLENTANESFLRQSGSRGADLERLLRHPAEGKTAPPPERPSVPKTRLESFRNEPLAFWFQPESQAGMRAALERVRAQFGREVPAVIGGRRVMTERKNRSENKSDPREVLGWVASLDTAQADQAVEAAEKAFRTWSRVPAAERAAVLRRAAGVMRERRFDLAAWLVYEAGKNWTEADADVAEAIDFLEYYGLWMEDHAADGHEPVGPGVVIAPWNFPLAIMTGMTAAALASGNTVLMKPAEQTSLIAAKLMDVFEAAGLPDGAANFVPGRGSVVGAHLIRHPSMRFVAFTGSTEVGQMIRREAAASPVSKRLVLETGGKNAIFIDRTADIDQAVEAAVQSFSSYNGQKCSAASRLIVHEELHDAVLERLKERAASIIAAPAPDPSSQVGPVIDRKAYDNIMRYIEIGKGEARLELGGTGDPETRVIAPTVFSGVSPDAVIAREEIFGPVLAVMKARDVEDALRIANGVTFGLTSGVFTRAKANERAYVSGVDAGVVYINRKITHAPVGIVGFGGIKASGTGIQAGGPDYMFQFLKTDPRDSDRPASGSPTGLLKDEPGGADVLAAAREGFLAWKAAGWARRWEVLARAAADARALGLSAAEHRALLDFLADLRRAGDEAAAGRPLRRVVGIANEFRYEPLGAGVAVPSKDRLAALRLLLTALGTGNAVVVPQGPDAELWREIFARAGLPAGAFSLAPVLTTGLLKDPRNHFVAYAEQDLSAEEEALLRRTAGDSDYFTRLVREPAAPDRAWLAPTLLSVARFLRSKSILEIERPEVVNVALRQNRPGDGGGSGEAGPAPSGRWVDGVLSGVPVEPKLSRLLETRFSVRLSEESPEPSLPDAALLHALAKDAVDAQGSSVLSGLSGPDIARLRPYLSPAETAAAAAFLRRDLTRRAARLLRAADDSADAREAAFKDFLRAAARAHAAAPSEALADQAALLVEAAGELGLLPGGSDGAARAQKAQSLLDVYNRARHTAAVSLGLSWGARLARRLADGWTDLRRRAAEALGFRAAFEVWHVPLSRDASGALRLADDPRTGAFLDLLARSLRGAAPRSVLVAPDARPAEAARVTELVSAALAARRPAAAADLSAAVSAARVLAGADVADDTGAIRARALLERLKRDENLRFDPLLDVYTFREDLWDLAGVRSGLVRLLLFLTDGLVINATRSLEADLKAIRTIEIQA